MLSAGSSKFASSKLVCIEIYARSRAVQYIARGETAVTKNYQ
jgi:hypothetical protein